MCQLSMLERPSGPRSLAPEQSLSPRPLSSSAEREKKRRRRRERRVKQISQGGSALKPHEWRAGTLAAPPGTPAALSGSSDGQEGGRATDREREWLRERGREWEGKEEDAEDEYTDENEDHEVAEDGMGREARPFRAMAADSFHRVPALSSVTDRTDSVAANGRPAPQPHASCPSILDICAAPSGRAWLQQAPRGSTAAPLARAMADASPIAPRSLLDRERSDTCPGLSSHPAPEASWKSPQRSMSDSLSGIPGAWRAALLPEVVAARKCLSLPLGAIAPRGHVAEAGAAMSPALVSWHAGAGPHACSICGMRFPTVQALGGHRNGHRELKGVHPDLPHRSTAGKRRPRGKTSKIREKENEREREREREREVQSWGVSAGPKQDPNSGFSPSLVPVSAQSSGGEGMSTTGGAEMKHLGGSLDGLSVPFLAFHQQQHQGTVSRDGKLMSAIEPCCGQYCNFFSVPCRSTRVLSGCHGKAFPKAAPSSSPSSLPSTTTTLPSQSFLSPTSTGRGSEPPLLLTETERPVKESGSPPSAKGLSKKTWLAQEILRRLAEEQSSAAAQLEADARLPEGEALRNGRARQRVDLNLKLAL